MIYLDSSVALAYLFGETRRPEDDFWRATFASSRLLKFEVFNRINARRVKTEWVDAAQALLHRVQQIELASTVLERALDPFPVPVRTLDALHLATMHHLRERGVELALASYDERLVAAARAMGFEVAAM